MKNPPVRLRSGALAVFSPVALTPEVRSTVAALGNDVRYLTALDYEHHLFLPDWAAAFPSAKLLGVEGLPEKKKGSEFAHIWTSSPNKEEVKVDPEFDAEFEVEYVGAHSNKELVFCHKPDRTLIQADLMFNLPATEQYSRSGESASSGLLTRMFIGLQNTVGRATWQKRFLWYVASSGDRAGFARSVKRIDGWDFDRIIPCHGDVIETGGKGIFRTVMEWHLQAAKKST